MQGNKKYIYASGIKWTKESEIHPLCAQNLFRNLVFNFISIAHEIEFDVMDETFSIYWMQTNLEYKNFKVQYSV